MNQEEARKAKKVEYLHAEVTPRLKSRIRAAAHANKSTMQDWLVKTIRAALRETAESMPDASTFSEDLIEVHAQKATLVYPKSEPKTEAPKPAPTPKGTKVYDNHGHFVGYFLPATADT